MKYLIQPKTINEVTNMGGFGFFTDDRLAWQIEFEKLSKYDFDRLGIEKDKLYNALEKLHDWRVIR